MKTFTTRTCLLIIFLTAYAINLMAQNTVPAEAEQMLALMPQEIEAVKAPFEMPAMSRPDFGKKVVTPTMPKKKGALCTAVIQKAIDKMSANGGGTVVLPKGKWLTGRVTLKSNVCLLVDEGVELHFSGDAKDYLPAVAGRNEGVDIYGPGAMIYADGAENIAVMGKGKIVAPERDCELLRYTMAGIPESVQDMPLQNRIFDGYHKQDVSFGDKTLNGQIEKGLGAGPLCLPVFFGPMNSKNVFLEGVTFVGSVFWNIVPVYCDNIIIRGVKVLSAGIARTDGIDIDSSTNALIEYTYLDCGDDCFTLKAGRGMDGVNKARPTANVVIRHCYADHGAGGLTIGSETAAMVRNVYMQDVTISRPKYGIYFKTRRPRGGGGENMWFEDIRMHNPKTRAIYWDMLGSATYVGKLAERDNRDNDPRLTPCFRNIFFENVRIDDCGDYIKAIGLPESPIENVIFKNIKSGGSQKVTLQDVGKFTIE